MKIKNNFILAIIQCLVGIMAIPAGFSFILQPDGTGLGMSTGVLEGSPFSDFLIPGIFLVFFNGVFHIIGSVLTYKGVKISSIVGLGLGIYLALWICIQVYFIGLSHFLQPLFLFVALMEIFLSYQIMRKN